MKLVASGLVLLLGLAGVAGCAESGPTSSECVQRNGPQKDVGVESYAVVGDRLLRVQSKMFGVLDIFGTPTAREDAKSITITWPVSLGTSQNESNTAAGCAVPAVGVMKVVDVQLRAPLGNRTVVQAQDGKSIRKDTHPYSDGQPRPTITATAS